jgi:2-iminobutanoate/2-iminopropanoate deaminase
MTHPAVHTDRAPKAIGPYSQAKTVELGGGRRLIFSAGQLGLDPATGQFAPGGVEGQTDQALKNLTAVLEAAGAGWEHVVKTVIFLADMKDFGVVNPIYGKRVADPPPARSTVAVKELPMGGLVEIEVVAVV